MNEATSRALEGRSMALDEHYASREPASVQEPAVGDLLRQINALDTQDSAIWARNVLILIVFCAGFLSLVYPNLMWDMRELNLDGRYLPQLFFGLTALVVLYNAHIMDQRKKLRFTREQMVRQLLRAESTETQALIDPLTQVYNRKYLEKTLERELGRADRLGTSLVVVMIDLDGFKSVNTRFGHLAGDQVLCEVAKLLNRVFRRSDTIIRYGGDEFLILMPDTDQEQAAYALGRLQHEGAIWSRQEPHRQYSVGFSCGIGTYCKGADIREVIQTADSRMYTEKARHHAANSPR